MPSTVIRSFNCDDASHELSIVFQTGRRYIMGRQAALIGDSGAAVSFQLEHSRRWQNAVLSYGRIYAQADPLGIIACSPFRTALLSRALLRRVHLAQSHPGESAIRDKGNPTCGPPHSSGRDTSGGYRRAKEG